MSISLIAVPEALAAASADLSGIGEAVREASASAAPWTTGIVAAAADEVSGAVARLFGGYVQVYQALGAQAVVFQRQFVQALGAGAGSYAAAEVANGSALQTWEQTLLGAVNAPSVALTGRVLIGNGASGAPGSGDN